MLFHKLSSTSLGIGYIGKGAGTVAAVACCICWYFAWAGDYPPLILAVSITIAITLLGVWSSSIVEKIWGKDPARVVIDEVAGMCIGLLFVPVSVKYVILALILFRFFDIVKPLFIRKMEELPSGWGIMMDDVLAGIYTNIIVNTVVWFKIF
ncbi:phosphatidylglycerophosphatase A [Mucilaginibacter frigoritolerans]|jgi:phosphatidylglycerophosphatase A|uniref:Phosphatidylglycerophosphatase A n=1 Tax=Mucilaginibacter frigoritolerans TaxID=652788 RepID=A0A562TWW6_9SPHI|nr:phosphatidylglycerophosphatase A [Mucilaginibacter frigoritolerans]TWI98109.1 phosphatidylglycerophosphatase A [Mucilaginibacter frigoritolerans]